MSKRRSKGLKEKRKSKILRIFPGAEILGVGRRSVVLKKGKLVIKVEKDSHPGTAAREAKWLRELNKEGIGPKLISLSRKLGYVTYNYVDGVTLPEFVERCSPTELVRVLKLCLKKARKLDLLGISKEEMHRPVKHIWVGKDVKFIDFERCHRSDKPKNVTQLCHFLFVGDNPCAKKVRDVFHIDKADALEAAKQYRTKGLELVLSLLDLDHVPKC